MAVVTAPVAPLDVSGLEGFFRELARLDGVPHDAESVCLMLAEATLRIAAGQTRLWVALAQHSAPCTLHPAPFPVGMFQIDERFDPGFSGRGTVYEARRLYVAPGYRGGRVALALLKRAALDLPDREATLVFTVAQDRLPRLYRRLGAAPLRALQGMSVTTAKQRLLGPITHHKGDLAWAEPRSPLPSGR